MNTWENEEQVTCLWNLQLQVLMRRVAENEMENEAGTKSKRSVMP